MYLIEENFRFAYCSFDNFGNLVYEKSFKETAFCKVNFNFKNFGIRPINGMLNVYYLYLARILKAQIFLP